MKHMNGSVISEIDSKKLPLKKRIKLKLNPILFNKHFKNKVLLYFPHFLYTSKAFI